METNAVQSVPKIMVVEDDPHVLRQIAFALEHEGYSVTTATAGDDALRQLMRERPDLLVTDVMMPGLDGYDLVDQLRRDESLCDLPVIMVTARKQMKTFPKDSQAEPTSTSKSPSSQPSSWHLCDAL